MTKAASGSSLNAQTMTLDLPACERIVAATKLQPAANASKTLEVALAEIVPDLIRKLDGKPIPNTYDLGIKIQTLRSATNRLFETIGLPRRGAQPSRRPLPLNDIVLRLSDRPGGPNHQTIHREIRKLTKQVFWLRQELDELEGFYGRRGPRQRQYNLERFCVRLLSIYLEVFDRPVGTSRSNNRPSGPSLRFVLSTFSEIADLVKCNGDPEAEDFFRSVTRHTVDDLIRKFKAHQ